MTVTTTKPRRYPAARRADVRLFVRIVAFILVGLLLVTLGAWSVTQDHPQRGPLAVPVGLVMIGIAVSELIQRIRKGPQRPGRHSLADPLPALIHPTRLDVHRVWRNTWFGRTLGTVGGLVVVAIPFSDDPAPGTRAWHGWNLVIGSGAVLIGLLAILAVWTSKLELRDCTLTATNFFVTRSMPLVDVVSVEPSWVMFFGIKIHGRETSGLRTLISGQAWTEMWTPRATKVAREIRELAAQARGEAVR